MRERLPWWFWESDLVKIYKFSFKFRRIYKLNIYIRKISFKIRSDENGEKFQIETLTKRRNRWNWPMIFWTEKERACDSELRMERACNWENLFSESIQLYDIWKELDICSKRVIQFWESRLGKFVHLREEWMNVWGKFWVNFILGFGFILSFWDWEVLKMSVWVCEYWVHLEFVGIKFVG